MNESYAPTLRETQHITQEYASFSQSRSGLGNVLGGVAGLGSVATMWFLGAGLATAGITLGLTALWLIGKEVLRQRIYRSFGEAREIWSPGQRRGHIYTVGVMMVALTIFAVMLVVHAIQIGITWPVIPYLAFCLVAPLITWRWLRTTNEMLVGIYLLFDCAITCAGFVPDRLLLLALIPLYAVLMIFAGVREHRQFLALSHRLHAAHQPYKEGQA